MGDEDVLQSALRKVAWRLPPFMGLIFLLSFIDRANVSFAALSMNKDLGFTPTVYAWGVGFFFFSYVLLGTPSNLMLERVGARRWIAPMVILWGAIAIAMASVNGPRSFFALRFLLGAAEAGLLPGLLLYLTYWFPPHQRARMGAMFLIAIPFSNAVGAPLSGFILDIPGLDGALGLRAWQWLFVIEGFPALIAGLAVYKLMPDRPKDAPWLAPEERAALEGEIARAERHDGPKHVRLVDGLLSGPVLLLSLAYFGSLLGGYGIIFWTPQIVKAFGLTNAQTGLVTAIPFLAGSIAMVVLGVVGDRTGRRTTLVVAPMLVGALGLLLAGTTESPVVATVALTIAAGGIYGMLPAFWTLPTVYLKGPAAAGGFAMVNSVGAFAGFVGPYIIGWVKEETGAFGPGLAILSLGAVMTAAIVAWLARGGGRGAAVAAGPRLA